MDGYPNVRTPCVFLDNDFRNPELDRYLDRVERYDPSVAVLGDAYTGRDAARYQQAVDELQERWPAKTYVVAPKCERAFDVLDEDVVLRYPLGYSELDPSDYSETSDWRGRPVHVLGGSTPRQYEVPNGEFPWPITLVRAHGLYRFAIVSKIQIQFTVMHT